MISKKLIEQIAQRTGFKINPIEKVLLLRAILLSLAEHEELTDKWVLKGGTALNLFYLNLPRLSVDIDLNFIGVDEVSQLPKARERFERILISICEREKCTVKRVPDSHAGGKFRLRYSSLFGGSQNLEVDVNYLMRIPLLGTERAESNFPPRDLQETGLAVPTLKFKELAAGKFAALLDRFAARDVFDTINILSHSPDILDQPDFKAAFVCYVASAHIDIRTRDKAQYVLESEEVKNRLLPLLSERGAGSSEHFISLSSEIVKPAIERLLTFTAAERAFLSALIDEYEIKPELLTEDVDLKSRILKYPPLLWRQKQLKKL